MGDPEHNQVRGAEATGQLLGPQVKLEKVELQPVDMYLILKTLRVQIPDLDYEIAADQRQSGEPGGCNEDLDRRSKF